MDIYQSNWGKFAQVTFNNEQITLPVESFKGEEVVLLPLSDDVGLKLKVVQASNDIQPLDPSSDVLELYSISASRQKFLGSVKKGNRLQLGPINIGYFGTQTLTGLQFKSNPGSFLIYPGLFFIVCGVFISFGSRKQIWVRMNVISNKIMIGGNSDRAKGKFFEEFENLVSEFSNSS